MEQLFIVALVPAHNEQESIAATIEALLSQTRLPDVIAVLPNGCTDETASIARRYPVTVLELPKLDHKKSEALNIGWAKYGREADVVICLDADTVLPPNAVKDWEQEFIDNLSTTCQPNYRLLGGSSSKFTMLGGDFLTRLQRAEFSRWTDTALARGYTTVLAGTGCAISGEALRQVVSTTGRDGPWSYDSQVEDFELTYKNPPARVFLSSVADCSCLHRFDEDYSVVMESAYEVAGRHSRRPAPHWHQSLDAN